MIVIFVYADSGGIFNVSLSLSLPPIFFLRLLPTVYREAVRQRKALSRTSSNILLNSVQMGHNAHNLNQYHHINYNNHPSECDLNSKLKDLKEETSQNSFSNIEVIHIIHNAKCVWLFCWCCLWLVHGTCL